MRGHPGRKTGGEPAPGRAPGIMLLLLAFGCAPAGSPDTSVPTNRQDVLTGVDLALVQDYTTLQAIRQLRPRWLRARGPSIGVDAQSGAPTAERGEARVRVYLDGVLQRDVQSLDLIRVPDVTRLRYLGAPDATMRFGIDHEGGAILVTTRAG